MKKMILPVLTVLLLASCGRDKALDIELLEKAEHADEVYALINDYRPSDEYYGDWGDEGEYDVPDTSEYDGIVTYSNGMNGYYDGKFYFGVTKKYQDEHHISGSSTEMYIDLATGESHYVCTDPLCSHIPQTEENCGSFFILTTHIKDGKSYRFDMSFGSDDAPWIMTYTLTERDLASGETKALYSFSSNSMEGENKSAGVIGIDGNLLWFYEIETFTDEEARTESTHSTMYSYDLTTGECSEPYHFPEEYDQESAGFLWVQDGLFYMCSPQTRLFVTDETFAERRVLIDEPMPVNGWEQVSCNFYDENTGEVFLLYGNSKQREGTIYRVFDGEIEELSMPHEAIYTFKLTRDKIYYMTYDPYIYVTDEETGRETADYGGGKIYVTDRETRETADLFFDSEMQIPLLSSWNVIGNYVYVSVMDYNPNGEHPFSSAFNLKLARINVADETIRYFRFE